jgi:hypothetical protein
MKLFNEKTLINKIKKYPLEIITFLLIVFIFTFGYYNITIWVNMDNLAQECFQEQKSDTIKVFGREMKAEYTKYDNSEIIVVEYQGNKKEYIRYNISRVVGETVGSTIKETAKGFWDGIWKNQNEKNPK